MPLSGSVLSGRVGTNPDKITNWFGHPKKVPPKNSWLFMLSIGRKRQIFKLIIYSNKSFLKVLKLGITNLKSRTNGFDLNKWSRASQKLHFSGAVHFHFFDFFPITPTCYDSSKFTASIFNASHYYYYVIVCCIGVSTPSFLRSPAPSNLQTIQASPSY